MEKPNLNNLSGQDLFEYYTSKNGEYKQTLFTAYTHIGDKLFDMLKDAETQGKKIVLKEAESGIDDTPITVVVE